MIKNIKDLTTGIIDLIYPQRCVICQNRLDEQTFTPLCLYCFKKISWNLPPTCSICGRKIPVELSPENICFDCKVNKHFFDRAWSVALYEGVMRECIHKFKYERCTALVCFFVKVMNDFIDNFINMDEFDCIVPIPLHPAKFREREFNQAFLIAHPIARRFRKRLLNNIRRVKFTLPQTELSAKERFKNIKGAFELRKENNINGKNILIIDDVFTTGATVDECARLLKLNKANFVGVLTLAC
ncbi:MAG: ComF family protein [Candidatus Omnitrophota bacterium]